MNEFIVSLWWGEGRKKAACFKRENTEQIRTEKDMYTWTEADLTTVEGKPVAAHLVTYKITQKRLPPQATLLKIKVLHDAIE